MLTELLRNVGIVRFVHFFYIFTFLANSTYRIIVLRDMVIQVILIPCSRQYYVEKSLEQLNTKQPNGQCKYVIVTIPRKNLFYGKINRLLQ